RMLPPGPTSILPIASRPPDRRRSVNQTHMGERLREIPKHRTRVGIDLLAKQTKVVGEFQKMFELPLGFLDLTALNEIVDRPEAANAECALAAVKRVVSGFIPIEQPIALQPARDAVVRGHHAGISGVLVTKADHQQQTRIDA